MRAHLVISSLLFTLVMPAGILHASGSHDEKPGHESKKDGHGHKTPHWAKTLSKKHKKMVDDMHHELNRILKPLKKDENQKQEELNRLTIKDEADLSKINAKIDELMAIKNKILRHRHAHLVEMRVILTDEQRVSYDKAVLKRDKIK